MKETNIKQPASASSSPRFVNMGTFMRMQRITSLEDLDFAIVGVPLIQQVLLEQDQDLDLQESEIFQL